MVSERGFVLPNVFGFLPTDGGESASESACLSLELCGRKESPEVQFGAFCKIFLYLVHLLLLSISALFICLFLSVKEMQQSNYS